MVLWKEAQARQALAELKGFIPVIPNQNILINAITLQEAKESSAIENIITTQDELYKYFNARQSGADPSAKEVLNYREAVFKGLEIIKKRNLIGISDIVKIQETIVNNNAGIRKLAGTSLINEATGESIYTPPQDFSEINILLDNFCNYLNNDENSLWKMAVLHYQFEMIHPFYDGNGRTGRILNILYLLLKNYLDSPVLYLSSYIIKTKENYYKLLQEVYNKDVWENWILYILNAVEETSKMALEKVKYVRDLLELFGKKIHEQCPGIYSAELVDVIFENPYSKIDFLVKRLNINRKTASKYLKELEENNFLSHVQIGREMIYINDKLMKVLSK